MVARFPLPIDSHTQLLAIIGRPVAHSLSPAMHNAAIVHHELNLRYLAFDIAPERLLKAVHGMAAMGVVGFNATIPHKEALLPLMHTLSPIAKRIGAVNTVTIASDGKMHGHNTDAEGFVAALREAGHGANISAEQILLLGAGGSARAIVVGLLQAGARHIIVANRTLERANSMLASLGQFFPNAKLQSIPLDAAALPLEQSTLLVNTTSQGLGGESIAAVDVSRLPPGSLVCDIVYRPAVTPLLAAAQSHGLETMNGLGMLIHQGALAFKIWTGCVMPIDQVRPLLEHLLKERA